MVTEIRGKPSAAQGGCQEVVLDAELVAVDREKANELKSFQELSTRARGAITALEVKVPVCVFAFDCLYVDGESLLKRPLQERRERLAAALPNLQPGFVCLAHSHVLQAPIVTASEVAQLASAAADAPAASGDAAQLAVVPPATPERAAARQPSDLAPDGVAMEAVAPDEHIVAAVEGVVLDAAVGNEGAQSAAEAGTEALIREHLQDALAAGTEGLMLKALTGPSATYQPSKRSNAWLKIKRDYCEELRDSLDLVPIGAWHGNGRKVGWYSPFLLAAWDPEAEEFQSVCRCMSGFTDAFYAQAKERLDHHRIDERRDYYNTNERPSVWFEPTEVWELRGADLTLSAVHKAAFGLIHPTRGVSLRFPRFVRMREDKRPEEASGPDVIRQLFNAQTRKLVTAREAVAKRDGKASATPAPAVLDSDEEGAVGNGAEEEVAMELPDE